MMTRTPENGPASERPPERARRPVPCADHLGNPYDSISAMCRAWNVRTGTYAYRRKTGMTVEQALTGETRTAKAHIAKDHTSHVFPTQTTMCEAWNVHPTTFRGRMKHGMTLEEALTTEKRTLTYAKPSTDHTGRKFDSINDMCRAWGINVDLYLLRRKAGWSIERALTEPVHEYRTKNNIVSTDHLGRTFPTIASMCREWRINPHTYKKRIRSGMSVKDALTTPNRAPRGRFVPTADHTGRTFPSVQEMCDSHGTSRHTFNGRRRKGWDTEAALTGMETCVTDHTGEKFPTLRAMCEKHGIDESTYRRRLKRGMTMEQALTARKPRDSRPQPVTDPDGRDFPSIRAMCRAWGIEKTTYLQRRKAGMSMEEALTQPGRPRPANQKDTDRPKGTTGPERP